MKTIWILFSVANDYSQPEKAFEKLFWSKPTYEDLKEYGFDEKDAKRLIRPNYGGMTEYWVESFTEDK